MPSLLDRFSEPLPPWIDDINQEIFEQINASTFAGECRAGNARVMRELVLGFWPFVDAFPKMINQGCVRLLREDLFKNHGVGLVGLFRTGFELLLGMEKDEESHRSLWVKVANAVGLSRGELERAPMPEVEAINESVGQDTDPFTMLLRFVAVEIVAEGVSKNLLSSKSFISAVGEEGSHWFRVHVTHGGITHEELALRLACTLSSEKPERDGVRAVIQPVVDLFIAAADKCVEIAMAKQSAETLPAEKGEFHV